MDQDLSQEAWRHLRQEARDAAAQARAEQAERLTRAALEKTDQALLEQVEQRLDQLNKIWAVHQKPLLTRIPVIGRFLAWLGSGLARFLLQHQVTYNAEAARTLQELYQLQQLLAQGQIERADDLFFRLEQRLLALEARLQDLEKAAERLRPSL